MRKNWILNLQIFDGGAGAGAAGGAGGAGGDAGTSAEGMPAGNRVTILEDGTQVDQRLAERMEKQRKRHPERAQRGLATPAVPQGMPAQQDAAQTAKTPDEEFEELIKGKYKDQYQARFQQGINDRFRNQADLQGQLDGLKPMLDALAKQHGTEPGDYKALSDAILDDDSLYEEEAEEAGMTVEAYKNFLALKKEADAARAREEESQEQMAIREHLQKLIQQGEELKKVFPNFDLRTELGDPRFRRMTDPNVGLSVEQAFYAIHHNELAPQAYAAGIQRAQRQIGASIQANANRPVEGAMQGNAATADIHISPRNMTREQRRALAERAMRGEEIVL